MEMNDLTYQTLPELLVLHVSIMEELRNRGVLRSENNPTGDLAEHLFCSAFGWKQAPNSQKGFDAKDKKGTRYQIKGRRINNRNPSRQVSSIRDMGAFDFLAAVLFDHHYRVLRAALIPVAVVEDHSTHIEYTNSYRFMLQDSVWEEPDVKDVTDQLRRVLISN